MDNFDYWAWWILEKICIVVILINVVILGLAVAEAGIYL